MRALPLIALGALVAAGCRKEEPAPAPPPPAFEGPTTPPCVYFKELRAFLPASLPGYRTARDEGSTGKYGDVSVSEAERVFAREGGELAVRIVDTTVAGALGEKIAAAAKDASGRDPKDPTAPLLLDVGVGFMRFDPGEARAEANLLVGGRFVVAVTGRGVKDTVEVRQVAQKLDLAGLSKLR